MRKVAITELIWPIMYLATAGKISELKVSTSKIVKFGSIPLPLSSKSLMRTSFSLRGQHCLMDANHIIWSFRERLIYVDGVRKRHFSDWVPFLKCHFESRNNRINQKRWLGGELILMTLITGIIGFNCCHFDVHMKKVMAQQQKRYLSIYWEQSCCHCGTSKNMYGSTCKNSLYGLVILKRLFFFVGPTVLCSEPSDIFDK